MGRPFFFFISADFLSSEKRVVSEVTPLFSQCTARFAHIKDTGTTSLCQQIFIGRGRGREDG